jgi:hypothetical protein
MHIHAFVHILLRFAILAFDTLTPSISFVDAYIQLQHNQLCSPVNASMLLDKYFFEQ